MTFFKLKISKEHFMETTINSLQQKFGCKNVKTAKGLAF